MSVPILLESALSYLRDEYTRVMENIHQTSISTPFDNTGSSFKCDTFEVNAYDWGWDFDDDTVQPYNFKWRDLEVFWYKYLGRDMYTNREISNDEISEMLKECIESLNKLDKEII